MKIINTQKELEELIDINNNIIINEALDIRCDICIDANINAGNINALNIDAGNIDAGNINAGNISYYAVCCAYESITCKSIIGRRGNSKHFALDGTITIK
jgi:hypothetical protein